MRQCLILPVIAFTLALVGCASLPAPVQGILNGTASNPVTLRQVYELRAAYAASAAEAFTVYRRLPWCSKAPAPCQTGAIARKISAADVTVRRELDLLEAYVKAHRFIDIAAVQAGVQQALAEANALAAQYGLAK